MSLLAQSAVLLCAAVLAIPLALRCGLGAVLGYLLAGLAIGPWGLALVDGVQALLHFAELGVVLLLFVIGLELQPSRLWALRKAVFGLGGAQLAGTAVVLGAIAVAFGFTPAAALVIGLSLSLSSTAFALQTLAEKRQLTTRHGRSAFAILLFQDLAVVPLLALVPLLSPDAHGDAGSGVVAVLKVVLVITATVFVGRKVLGLALRIAARARVREVFTALALLCVIGTSLLMDSVGLSMALGAFMAGVLLADSQYRHALEADIEPFKGLLLGLFFMAVGMSLNLGLLLESPLTVLGLAVGLVLLKFCLLVLLARLTGHSTSVGLRMAAAIAQGGEFAFVIFGVAVPAGVMQSSSRDLLVGVVTVSMILSPFLFMAVEALLARGGGAKERDFDRLPDDAPAVIIAGFGRFGQIVGRILRARNVGFTALDASSDQVDFVRNYGNKIFYGDASRLDLLQAAQADKAAILVLAIDDVQASLATARTAAEHFPGLRIYARARNRKHAYQLMDLGVKCIRRETFASSLEIAEQVLRGLGLPHGESARLVKTFREHDVKRLNDAHESHTDEERMRYLARESARELQELFAQDAADGALSNRHSTRESGTKRRRGGANQSVG